MRVAMRQRDVLRKVMKGASRGAKWMTLKELEERTRYPQASISAQLRHLRKPENGGYVVEKRRREAEEIAKGSVHERVWEYRLKY